MVSAEGVRVRLYLMRHGTAADRMTWAADDASRPLVERGEAVTRRVAEALARAGASPGAILTSPYPRASQTAEIIADVLGVPGGALADERLEPGFAIRDLRSVLAEVVGPDEIMLVGHEPDLSELTADLTGGSRVVFKKSGVARVDLSDLDRPEGRLVWLAQPALLAH